MQKNTIKKLGCLFLIFALVYHYNNYIDLCYYMYFPCWSPFSIYKYDMD